MKADRSRGVAETSSPGNVSGMWFALLSGLLAVTVGLLVGELLSVWLSPSLSPLNAVGSAMIDLMPPGVKDWAVANFGTDDKTVFGVVMRVVAGLLACLAGVLERRRRGAGVAVVIAIGLLTALAAITRHDGGAVLALLGLLSAVVAAVVLRALIRRLGERGERPVGADGIPEGDRRGFLRLLAATAVGAAVLAAGDALARGVQGGYQAARAALRLPVPSVRAAAAPADAQVPGISSWTTPNDSFYRIDTALVVPFIDPDTWSLKVTGMVERPLTLSFQELLVKPLVEHDLTLCCVSNEVGGNLIGNARWLGWPVRELLAEAGVKPGADMVLSSSSDGFTAGTPLTALQDGRAALLAVGMNGQPLPAEHGFPVRLVVPGLYGYVSATKWVTELKVTTFAQDQAYWSTRGWSEKGPIKRSSRIDAPRQGGSMPAGGAVAGVAWAQGVGVAGVEVRLDDGPWRPARLAGDGGADSWRQWWVPLAELDGAQPSAGTHRLTVRMTGRDGVAQSTVEAPPAPDGSSGLHIVDFQVS
ncbi:molybdopterin-dependent oxidoreductase [Arthrobacter sp. NPDC090010]|uniref:molybdopterin-dependent oxidoreductase n=1 Tax=Arthrobacter sp. NPDC090010 TaxID=3363942 RepID=UPI0037FFEA84